MKGFSNNVLRLRWRHMIPASQIEFSRFRLLILHSMAFGWIWYIYVPNFCMGGDSNHKVLGYGIMQFRHLLRNAVKVSLVVLWFPLSWANDGNYFFKWVLDHISMWSRKQLFHDGCSVLTLWWRSKSESRWGSISNHGEATEDHRAFWRKLGSKPEKIRQNTWFENYPKYLIRIFSLFLIRNSSRKMTITLQTNLK